MQCSGSHDYAIYRREAKDELGLNINKPDDEQYAVIKRIYENIRDEMMLLQPFNPSLTLGTENENTYSCRRALLESVEGGTDVYISEGIVKKNQQLVPQPPPLPPIERTIIENQMTFEGWRHESAGDEGERED